MGTWDNVREVFANWKAGNTHLATSQTELNWSERFALTGPAAAFVLGTNQDELGRFMHDIGMTVADINELANLPRFVEQEALPVGVSAEQMAETGATLAASETALAALNQAAATAVPEYDPDFDREAATWEEQKAQTAAFNRYFAYRRQLKTKVFGDDIPKGTGALASVSKEQWAQLESVATQAMAEPRAQQRPTASTAREADTTSIEMAM